MELVSGKRIKGGKLEKNRFECRDRRGCLKIEFLKNSLVFMAQKTKNTRFLVVSRVMRKIIFTVW